MLLFKTYIHQNCIHSFLFSFVIRWMCTFFFFLNGLVCIQKLVSQFTFVSNTVWPIVISIKKKCESILLNHSAFLKYSAELYPQTSHRESEFQILPWNLKNSYAINLAIWCKMKAIGLKLYWEDIESQFCLMVKALGLKIGDWEF